MHILRILRRAAYTILALVLALFLFVQFQQRLLRHRAERLHAEIVALQLHPGTFADIQRLQREWGRFAHYDGECTKHHCILDISLMDPLSGGIFHRHLVLPAWAVGSYFLMEAPPSEITAEIRVRDDKMWGADFSITVFSHTSLFPPDSIALWVQIDFGPRLFASHGDYNAFDLRRGYQIGGPGGCTFCIERWINISPAASPADVVRLNTINFGCMTYFRTCQKIDQLDSALKKDEQSIEGDAESLSSRDDCSLPLARLAQESDNIVLAEVTKAFDRTFPSNPVPYHYWTVRIISRIKNARDQIVGSSKDVDVEADNPGALGNRYFLFFHQPGNREDPSKLELSACGVFAETPANRQDVLNGIAKDSSVGEPYDRVRYP